MRCNLVALALLALACDAQAAASDALLFVSNRDGNAEIHVMQADGSGQLRLTREAAADNAPAWTADGRALRQLTADPADKGIPVLSPDSRWIACVGHRQAGGSDILLMPGAGGPARNLTADLSKSAKSYPSWSPDGRRIVFVSSREGTRTEMARGDTWLMDADGTHATNLGRHPDEDNYPAWSADGESIFFAGLRDGNAQFRSVSTGGAQVRRLTRSGGPDVMIRPRALPAVSANWPQEPQDEHPMCHPSDKAGSGAGHGLERGQRRRCQPYL